MHAGSVVWLSVGLTFAVVGALWLFQIVDDFGGGIAFVAGIGFVLMSIVGGVAAIESLECESQADSLNRDHRFGWAGGCRVESDDGDYVPIDNLRITSEEEA